MAISGIIEFHASSGALTHPRQMDLLVPGSGQMYNRIGQFGSSGPGSFVTLNTYQDTTYIVNEDGNPSGAYTASGKLTNLKYINSTSLNPNSSGSVAVSGITLQDATIRVRFTEPSGNSVTCQNVKFQCLKFNASSGVDDDTIKVSGLLVQVFEVGVNTSWTLISQTGTNNYLALANRDGSSIMHDFHIGLSVSPLAVGIRKDFGYLFKLEYL